MAVLFVILITLTGLLAALVIGEFVAHRLNIRRRSWHDDDQE